MNQKGKLSSTRILLAFLFGTFWMLLTCMNTALAQQQPKEDRTLSPFFFVNSSDATTDQLPLKSTQTEVAISGVIANVTVTQVYSNRGSTPLEATYCLSGLNARSRTWHENDYRGTSGRRQH